MEELKFTCPVCGAGRDYTSVVCEECGTESEGSFFNNPKEVGKGRGKGRGKGLAVIETPMPSEQELVRAKDRFINHMLFLRNRGTLRVDEEELREGNEHLEGALLDVLVGFVEDREG